MGVLNLFKRSVVVVTLVLLAGLALTPSARAVDPGFPPPTGDPSIIPAGPPPAMQQVPGDKDGASISDFRASRAIVVQRARRGWACDAGDSA